MLFLPPPRKTPPIRDPVLPGFCCLHLLSDSKRRLLLSPFQRTVENPFPARSRRRREGCQAPTGRALPRGPRTSPPRSRGRPGAAAAAAAFAAPRAAPAGRSRASLPHSSAQRPTRPPAAKRRLPPAPVPGEPRGQARPVGARTHQQRQQPHRGGGAPRHGRRRRRRLLPLPGTGSPPRAAREGKWRRPVEGRTSSRGWVECGGRGPRREGAGGARPAPAPAPAPAPPGPARGGEPRPPPPAPPSSARGSRRRLPRAAAVLPAQPGGRPQFPFALQSLVFIPARQPGKAIWGMKEARKATGTTKR